LAYLVSLPRDLFQIVSCLLGFIFLFTYSVQAEEPIEIIFNGKKFYSLESYQAELKKVEENKEDTGIPFENIGDKIKKVVRDVIQKLRGHSEKFPNEKEIKKTLRLKTYLQKPDTKEPTDTNVKLPAKQSTPSNDPSDIKTPFMDGNIMITDY